MRRFERPVCFIKSQLKLKMNITVKILDKKLGSTVNLDSVEDCINSIILKIFVYFLFIVGLCAYAFIDKVSKYIN